MDNEQIRMPNSTLARISQIRDLTNPYKAVEGFVDLVENYFLTERGFPKGYSLRNGKPATWEWKPYERFQQKVESEGFLFNNELEAKLKGAGDEFLTLENIEIINPKVIRFFDKNKSSLPYLVKSNLRHYVIYLDSISWSYGPGDRSVKSGIVIMPANELTLEGLSKSSLRKGCKK